MAEILGADMNGKQTSEYLIQREEEYKTLRRERDDAIKASMLDMKKLAATEALLRDMHSALELVWADQTVEQIESWDKVAIKTFENLIDTSTPTAALNAAIAEELERMADEAAYGRVDVVLLRTRAKELRG